MSKILNYIQNTNGIGAKYILIFSIIIAIFTTTAFRLSQNSLPERLQNTANQLLPIKIEDGTIVSPEDAIKVATLELFENAKSDEKLRIYLNTTVDSLDTRKLTQGIYITRKAVYTIAPRQVRTTYLESSFDIPAADYRPFFEKTLNYTTLVVFIFTAPILFITYFLFCLFYSWCASLIAGFLKRKTDFDMRMRISVMTMLPLKLLSYLLSTIGISLSSFTMFIVTLFCISLMIMKLPEEKKEA